MRVTVFGASTAVGLAVVEHALDAGHSVTVLARDPPEFPIDVTRENLRVIEGDVQDLAEVEDAVHGADAVVTAFHEALPHLPGTDNSDAIRNVLKELERYTGDRLVAVTGVEAGDAGGIREMISDYIRAGNEPNYEGQESLVRESDLDWTIVRPTGVTEGEETGEVDVRVAADGDGGTGRPITRGDLAAFVVAQLDDDTYVREMVTVSGAE